MDEKEEQKALDSSYCSSRDSARSSVDGLNLENFEIIGWLGKGAFGHVNLVKKKMTEELFALKVVNKEHVVKYDKVESVFRERDILQVLTNNPNIVHFEATFQDEKNLYFLMEYVQRGDLSDLLKNKPLPADLAKFYAAELLVAL